MSLVDAELTAGLAPRVEPESVAFGPGGEEDSELDFLKAVSEAGPGIDFIVAFEEVFGTDDEEDVDDAVEFVDADGKRGTFFISIIFLTSNTESLVFFGCSLFFVIVAAVEM